MIMKGLIFLLLMVAGRASHSNAQKLNESQIPVIVKHAFEKKYPGIKAGWDREDSNYEANFTHNGRAMSTVIDKSGTIVETEIQISVSELPVVVRDYMKKNYPGLKIEDAARIVRSNGEVNYEAEVHGKDVVFDVNGKFIKEMKD